MGEVENIGPGLTRQLIVSLPEAATYQLSRASRAWSEPASVRTSSSRVIRRRPPTRAASSPKLPTVTVATSAARSSRCRTPQLSSSPPSSPATSTRRRHSSPIARTYYERIEPEAESFGELDPKLDLREADLEPGQVWTGFHRPREGFVGDRASAGYQRGRRSTARRHSVSCRPAECRGLHDRSQPRSPATPKDCSTRSRLPRSPARKTSSRTTTDLWEFPGQRRRLASGDRGTEPDSAGT